MPTQFWSMKTALEQIEKCAFECEAGPLKNNVAWNWLVGAAKAGPQFWPGQGVYYCVSVDVAGARLSKWVHYYVVGCRMESDTNDRYWVYDLSNDPPAPWHGGKIHHRGVRAEKLRLQPAETAAA